MPSLTSSLEESGHSRPSSGTRTYTVICAALFHSKQAAKLDREAVIARTLPISTPVTVPLAENHKPLAPLCRAKPETSFPAVLWDHAQILKGPESIITAR